MPHDERDDLSLIPSSSSLALTAAPLATTSAFVFHAPTPRCHASLMRGCVLLASGSGDDCELHGKPP